MVYLSRGGLRAAPHYPPRPEKGFTVFFTGLSGSGKSTIANAFLVKLLEMGGRRVTLLDDATRKEVRDTNEGVDGLVLVHVAAPLEICQQRDRKGLYAKARAGIILEFTEISDPKAEPDDAELVIDTTDLAPDMAANQIILHLERLG